MTVDVVALPVELVGGVAEDAVEDLRAQRHQVGVGDPRPVEAGLRLAGLVLAHLGERALVDLGVAPARDERRHAADREGAAPVAGLHQQVAVGLHHRRRHRHRVAADVKENFFFYIYIQADAFISKSQLMWTSRESHQEMWVNAE